MVWLTVVADKPAHSRGVRPQGSSATLPSVARKILHNRADRVRVAVTESEDILENYSLADLLDPTCYPTLLMGHTPLLLGPTEAKPPTHPYALYGRGFDWSVPGNSRQAT